MGECHCIDFEIEMFSQAIKCYIVLGLMHLLILLHLIVCVCVLDVYLVSINVFYCHFNMTYVFRSNKSVIILILNMFHICWCECSLHLLYYTLFCKKIFVSCMIRGYVFCYGIILVWINWYDVICYINVRNIFVIYRQILT